MNQNVDWYVDGGVTLNYFIMSDIVIKTESFHRPVEFRSSFTSTNEFGYKLGGVIMLNKKVYFEVNYLGLGKPNIKQTVSSSNGDSERFEGKQMVSMIIFTLGRNFRL